MVSTRIRRKQQIKKVKWLLRERNAGGRKEGGFMFCSIGNDRNRAVQHKLKMNPEFLGEGHVSRVALGMLLAR